MFSSELREGTGSIPLTPARASLGLASVVATSLSSFLEQRIVDMVILEIDYNTWNATITEDVEYSLSGFGKTKRVLVKPITDDWTISIKAQKQDSSMSPLTISVRMKDGAVIGTQSTTEPYGIVLLTINIR